MSVSQAITRLKNRDTSILFIFKSYSWKFLLEIFSFLFAFSIFLCCRFSLKVHASGSQARQETAKRAMNGTYSQTGDAATPPVVCNAKKMQCQQQRRRQEKSVKIMQFMRYTWQEEQRFLAGTRTQGLTKVHRQTERKRGRERQQHTWRQLLCVLRGSTSLPSFSLSFPLLLPTSFLAT